MNEAMSPENPPQTDVARQEVTEKLGPASRVPLNPFQALRDWWRKPLIDLERGHPGSAGYGIENLVIRR